MKNTLIAAPLVILGALSFSFLGCAQILDASWEDYSAGPEEPAPPSEPHCEPTAERGPDAECGVFVDASSPSAGVGSRSDPLKELRLGIAIAALQEPGRRNVYVCVGRIEEAITTEIAGLRIFASLDCDNGWVLPADERKRTVLTAAPDQIPLTMLSTVTAEPSRLENLDVVAAPAHKDGGSSIAVVLVDVALDIIRCSLSAGQARAGLSPTPGEAGPDGEPGNPGSPACNSQQTPGGGEVTSVCPDGSFSIGGQGATAGRPGVPASHGVPAGESNYGAIDAFDRCHQGGMGAPGSDGVAGEQGRRTGTVSRSGYHGADGGNGGVGEVGEGGGGGGPSATMHQCPSSWATASGGSGGTGGCGGAGGRGGQAGGSSIALISISSLLHFERTTLAASTGGDGGSGAPGGPGGVGQPGGQGGRGIDSGVGTPVPAGCGGGTGGDGGHGGHGGGGRGGHSLGIAFVSEEPPVAGLTIATGVPGKGGRGSLGGSGLDGVRAPTLRFELNNPDGAGARRGTCPGSGCQ